MPSERDNQGPSEGRHSRCLDLAELWYLFFLLPKDEPVGQDPHDEREQNHVRRAEQRHFFSCCLRHGGAGVFVRVPHVGDTTVRREAGDVSEEEQSAPEAGRGELFRGRASRTLFRRTEQGFSPGSCSLGKSQPRTTLMAVALSRVG